MRQPTPTHPQEGSRYHLSCAKECIAAALSDLSSRQPGSTGGADALGLVQLLATVAPALSIPEGVVAGSGSQVWPLAVCCPLVCLLQLPSRQSFTLCSQ